MKLPLWPPLYDLAWTRLLLWVAGAGRLGEPKPEVHGYLAQLYYQLADACETQGRITIARWFRDRARDHDLASPPPDLPPAGAMAVGVPQPRTRTDARGAPLRSGDPKKRGNRLRVSDAGL